MLAALRNKDHEHLAKLIMGHMNDHGWGYDEMYDFWKQIEDHLEVVAQVENACSDILISLAIRKGLSSPRPCHRS